MAPLAIALCLDFYIVMAAVTDGIVAPLVAALFFGFVIMLWFVLPRAETLKWLLD
jgi:urea transporter